MTRAPTKEASSSKCALPRLGRDDVVGAAATGGLCLEGMTGEHRHRAAGKETLECGDRRQPDDARTDHEDRVAVGRRRSQQPVRRDRDRLVQTGQRVRHRVRKPVEHRVVREHLVGPSAAEPRRVPERPPLAQHPAVEIQTRGGPTSCTVRATRVDPPRSARDAGIDGNPGADCERGRRAGLDHPAGDLVTEEEGDRPE